MLNLYEKTKHAIILHTHTSYMMRKLLKSIPHKINKSHIKTHRTSKESQLQIDQKTIKTKIDLTLSVSLTPHTPPPKPICTQNII